MRPLNIGFSSSPIPREVIAQVSDNNTKMQSLLHKHLNKAKLRQNSFCNEKT